MSGKNQNREADAIRLINNSKKEIGGTDAVDKSDKKPSCHVSGSDTSTIKDSEPEPSRDGINLTPEQLKDFLAAGIAQKMKEVNQQIDQINQQVEQTKKDYEAEIQSLKDANANLEKKAEAEKRQKDGLTKLFTEFGYTPSSESDKSIPYIAPLELRGGMSSKDAVREFEKVRNDSSTQARLVLNPETSEQHLQQDTRALRRFIRKHREVLRDGVEAEMKKLGFLQGQISGYTGKDAPTTLATLPPMLQTYLSEITRIEHSARFVLWQLPNRRISTGVPPGQTTLVPRVKHLEIGTTGTDWELTPGTDLVLDNQPLQGSSQAIVIKENGVGKNANPVVMRPVAIPDFWMAYSLIDLEKALQDRLGFNYHQFEDVTIFETLIATTSVAYNAAGDVAIVPGDVATGGSGQITVEFLGSLYSYMDMLQIPTYSDGKYGYFCPSTHVGQLRKNMQTNHQYFDSSNVEEVTNVLTRSNSNEDMGRVSGYAGTIGGFHIFSGNSFSRGIAGTPGVQNEAFGGGARVTRSGFAVGSDTVGWASAMPMQIREEIGRFQRLREFTWISHEGWGPLDVDPASNPPISADQQLRVIEVRAADKAV